MQEDTTIMMVAEGMKINHKMPVVGGKKLPRRTGTCSNEINLNQTIPIDTEGIQEPNGTIRSENFLELLI